MWLLQIILCPHHPSRLGASHWFWPGKHPTVSTGCTSQVRILYQILASQFCTEGCGGGYEKAACRFLPCRKLPIGNGGIFSSWILPGHYSNAVSERIDPPPSSSFITKNMTYRFKNWPPLSRTFYIPVEWGKGGGSGSNTGSRPTPFPFLYCIHTSPMLFFSLPCYVYPYEYS